MQDQFNQYQKPRRHARGRWRTESNEQGDTSEQLTEFDIRVTRDAYDDFTMGNVGRTSVGQECNDTAAVEDPVEQYV